MSLFEFGAVDQIERDVYFQIDETLKGDSAELARAAIEVPIDLLETAWEERSVALAGRMLDLLVAAWRAALGSPTTGGEVARAQIWNRIFEVGHLVIEPRLTDVEAPLSVAQDAAAFLESIFGGFSDLLKAGLDADPRLPLVQQVNARWDRFLRGWDSRSTNRIIDVELLLRSGAPASEIAERERQIRRASELDELNKGLTIWRSALRLGLAMWCLRKGRQSHDEAWAEAFGLFAQSFGDLQSLADATSMAIEADFNDRSTRWTRWVLDEREGGTAHIIAVDVLFLQTFLVLALRLVDADTAPPEITISDWLLGRSERFDEVIDSLLDDPFVQDYLLPPDARARSLVIREVLADSQRRREIDDQVGIRQAALEPAKVHEFVERVATAWEETRLGFAIATRLRSPDSAEDVRTRAVAHSEFFIAKGHFITPTRVLGLDMVAQDIGRSLANEETEAVLAALSSAPVMQVPGQIPVSDAVRAAIAEMGKAAMPAALVITPLDWKRQALLADVLPRRLGGDAVPPWWLPPESQFLFGGLVDDLPIIAWPKAEQILVLSPLFIAAEIAEDQPRVSVVVEALSLEEAADLARRNPRVIAGEVPADQVVAEVQTRVRVRAASTFHFGVADVSAARQLRIQTE
jgi:hypothetical protein